MRNQGLSHKVCPTDSHEASSSYEVVGPTAPDDLPYIQRDTDRYGNVRLYVRIRGRQKRRLLAVPGSPAFAAEYKQALSAVRENDPFSISPAKRIPYLGSVEVHAGKVFASAKKKASERSLVFTVTRADAFAVLRAQNHRCSVSGLKFQMARTPNQTGSRLPFAPSLDRIDCGKGYEAGNVRWVLQAVNIALADWGDKQLLEIARAIVAKAGGRK